MVVLDSTFLIHLLKNKPGALAKLKTLPEPRRTTRLNVFEILTGIYRRALHEQEMELALFAELLETVYILELDDVSTRQAARLHAELMQQGLMISEMDVLIASIAMAHGETKIVTHNIKDFEKIPGIKIEKY